jgi:DNA mismatch repair protein MutS
MVDRGEIEKRLDIVQYFFEYHDLTRRIQELLKPIADLERLISRFTIGRTWPRDYLALKNSLASSGEIKKLLASQPHELVKEIASSLHDLPALVARIASTICDEPALSPEQGRVIREGHDAELDRLYELKRDSKSWLLGYEEKEKKRSASPL